MKQPFASILGLQTRRPRCGGGDAQDAISGRPRCGGGQPDDRGLLRQGPHLHRKQLERNRAAVPREDVIVPKTARAFKTPRRSGPMLLPSSPQPWRSFMRLRNVFVLAALAVASGGLAAGSGASSSPV